MNEYTVRTLTEDDAKEICLWKYDGEYAVYNMPKWEECLAKNFGIADEERRQKNYRAVCIGNELFGFINIMKRADRVELGLGMKPEFCGRHLGHDFVMLAVDEAKRAYPGESIVLKVRPFNKRAIKCYLNSGFELTETYYETKAHIAGEMCLMTYIG